MTSLRNCSPRRTATPGLTVVTLALAALLAACGSGSASTAGSSTTVASASPASTVAGVLALGRPVVLGHAAGEDVAPHSTMYGFAESVRAGVDVLDLDIQRTADDVLVVQHDDTTKRTTETDAKVHDLTYEQIHALDNGYWFSRTCANTCTGQPDADYIFRGIRTGKVAPPEGYRAEDFAVPRFADVAERWPDFVINIEIKGRAPDAFRTADLLAAEITRLGRTDSVVVTSFDDEVIAHFHALLPEVMMSPGLNTLTAYVLAGGSIPMWEKILQVPPVYEGVEVFTPAYVERTRAGGYINWVWPNGDGEDEAGYLDLFRRGADGVNASNPAAGVAARQAFEGD
ncbi:MAG: glycerophosphodiester phosphodiesterase [Acidobacteria bacterium]|nr:glycerophosphodiester phosphodiesterase [Acidobacteriota bacterium]